MGLESFPGGGKVRKRKGTIRPPTISPELWQRSSELEQNEAIATYLAQLEVERLAAETTAAAPGIVYHADPDPVFRLPREGEPAKTQEPNRDKKCTRFTRLHREELLQERDEHLPHSTFTISQRPRCTL